MKVPGEPEAQLDAANLHKVLGYSDQHRMVISRALKKAFPERWPDGRVGEDAFYEALFRLVEDTDSRSGLFDTLHALAVRKNKANWRHALFLNFRMTRQAFDMASDRYAAKAALEEGNVSDLCDLLAEEGHPEFGWWYRWVKPVFEAKAEIAEGAETEAEITDGEEAEREVADCEVLEREWRAALEELGHRATEAAEAPPSETFVDWLQGTTDRLMELTRCHAELTNLSGALQHCAGALDQLDAAGLPGVSELTARVREALARYTGPRQVLVEWIERWRAKGESLQEVHAREVKYREATQSALDQDDFAEVSRYSQQVQYARGEFRTALADLEGLVAEFDAQCPGGIEAAEATARAASIENWLGTIEDHGADIPDELSGGPPIGGDAQDGIPTTEGMGPEIGTAADNSRRDPVDGEMLQVLPSAVAPGVVPHIQPEDTSGVTAGLAAQPDQGALEQVPQLEEIAYSADLPHWNAQVPVQVLAEEMLRHEGTQRIQSARALAWALVREGRIPLAYHIARVAAEVSPPGPGDIRPEALRAIHLGGYLSASADEEVVELGETLRLFYEVDLADGALRGQRSLALLAFAAVLRPALMARHASGAEDLLRSLPLDENLSALHALREQILAPDFRYQAMLHLEPGSHLDELRNRAREWGDTNRRHSFNYEPATWVWQHLLEKGQTLGDALALITDGQPVELARARVLLQGLQNRPSVERMIRQADQSVRERKASKRPIEARPLTDMVMRCSKLAGLLSDWVEAVGEKAASAQVPGRELALRADRDRLLGNLERGLSLAETLQQATDLAESAAAACVAMRLRELRDRLDGTATGPAACSAWWRTLNGVLLPSDSVELVGERWEPVLGSEPEPLVVLAGLVNPPAWETSFDAANKGCDHARTAQILDWLRHEKENEDLLNSLERKREEGLRRCRKEFELDMDATRDEVERAASLGYLDEDDRSRIVATLEVASNQSRGNLREAKTLVRDVLNELRRLRDRQVSGIRQRIEKGEVSRIDPEAHRRICELLDAGDILTASEYLALLENGQSIPGPTERRDPFKDEFFPGFVERLQKDLGNRAALPKDIPVEINHGGQVGPVDMSQVPGAQRASAAEMLRAWLLIKARRGQVLDHLKLFLERLGLSSVEVAGVAEDGRDPREQIFDVNSRVISDRDICLVPRYGSHARGQYRVLCVWDRPSEEEVLASAQARSGGRAVIVLYLGQLTVKRRRDLAFRSRERSQTVLVIDETLVYFLCAERGSRLATLFDCAFPFTVAQPYVTTSSDVPAELFFGRRREVEDVFDQAGTNLVYGGRQLGKTALLREVVRRFHDPSRGSIVAWVDLKERHIGLSEPAEAVWLAIEGELVRRGLLVKARRGPEGTAEAITRWLDGEPGRRIVMLLDEADAFLAQDSLDADFKTVGTLKGLMERTGRRFKVVFAGLHNVQRTSRDVNTPLAHFGKPVCVGPLLANGEAREAYQLVELPLRQIGYRFESPALVNRILAQTNYYPNLIQIVCAHLLDYLQDVGNARFDSTITPPYPITRDHVEAISQSRDLQQTIRSRFQITLDLDNRYQIVALSVALATRQREEAGVGGADGFDPAWIRREALAWWPQGFPDPGYDAFRALLDEMVGLGVLRRAGPELRGYALRSPAIAGLLGSPVEIEQALLEASDKPPPELYQAGSYRRGRQRDPWVRSPLTGQQESEILVEKDGVVMLFGTVLAGLDWVEPFLKEMIADKDFVKLSVIADLQDLKGFETRLRAVLNASGKMDGTRLWVIPHTEPWTQAWVDLAQDQITRRRSSGVIKRVLFIGDSRAAWDWLGSEGADRASAVSILTLTPWAAPFVGQWARDAGFGPLSKDDLGAWGEVIGWWGGLLAALGERIKVDPAMWPRAFEIFQQQLPESLPGTLSQELPPELAHPLQVLANYGEHLSEGDWLELLKAPNSNIEREWLKRVIRWADLLSLVTPSEGGAWAIEGVVGRALTV